MTVWSAAVPVQCDACEQPLAEAVVDGRIMVRARANGHASTHSWGSFATRGGILGTDLGQRYQRQADGRFLKVED